MSHFSIYLCYIVKNFETLGFGGHDYFEMLQMLSQMNSLPSITVKEVKWSCCTRHNVQVPIFEIVILQSLVLEVNSEIKWCIWYHRCILYHEIMSMKWSCYNKQNAHYSSTHFEVETFEILGFGCHQQMEIIVFPFVIIPYFILSNLYLCYDPVLDCGKTRGGSTMYFWLCLTEPVGVEENFGGWKAPEGKLTPLPNPDKSSPVLTE